MAIVIPLCLAYALYCFFTQPGGPITTPDSVHYLSFSPIVPLGYPVFLSLVGARGATIAQPLLYASALAFLGRTVIRTTGRTSLAVMIVVGGMAVPQVASFHASILSESLFLSTLVLVLALAISFMHDPSWRLMVPIAVVVGLSATVRRAGFALLPALLIMVSAQRHRLGRSQAALCIAAAVVPFLGLVATEQIAATVVHGGRASSLMGRHIFAKAALLDAPAASKTGDALRAALDEHLEVRYAPVREMLARAPRDVRAVLTIYYETCLQGGCADSSRALMADWSEAQQTATLGDAGWSRIARAPAAFARLTFLHVGSLWTVDRLRHPGTAAALSAFVEANRPLPFEREAMRIEPGELMNLRPSAHVRYLQIAISALGIFTAALAVVGLVAAVAGMELPPLVGVASFTALVAHGALLFTALLAAGFSRFLLGVWPAIMTAALFGVWGIITAKRTTGQP